jgi:large subunit ribosomal protein L23
MKGIYAVIKRPLFTEKGTALKESENKILVEVARGANKLEIKKAFETIFKVKVGKVTTVNTPGKIKKMGKSAGMTPERKKAFVTLKKGEKLDFVQGA